MDKRITDERLAEFEEWVSNYCSARFPDTIEELLDAVEAERKEVERLQKSYGKALRRNARLVANLKSEAFMAREHAAYTNQDSADAFRHMADRIDGVISQARKESE